MVTKESIEKYFEVESEYEKLKKVIRSKVEEVFGEWIVLDQGYYPHENITDIGISISNVIVNTESEPHCCCGCCPSASYTYTFPTSYLYNPTWQDELKSAKLAKKAEEEAAKIARTIKRRDYMSKSRRRG